MGSTYAHALQSVVLIAEVPKLSVRQSTADLSHEVAEVRLGRVSDKDCVACLELPEVQLLIRAEQNTVTLTSDVTNFYPMKEIRHL